VGFVQEGPSSALYIGEDPLLDEVLGNFLGREREVPVMLVQVPPPAIEHRKELLHREHVVDALNRKERDRVLVNGVEGLAVPG